MNAKVIDRKVLAAKLAAGEKLSVEEVIALQGIATETEKEIEAEKEAEKLSKYVEKCVAELQKFEATDAKSLKIALRNMANDVPVSANGAKSSGAPKPIDPENTVKGSYAEFVVDLLKASPSKFETLVEATKKQFADRKPQAVENGVAAVLKRLGKHATEKDGVWSIA
jgi:hypothetical protein